MLKCTRNSYWRIIWNHKFKVTEGIWTYTCAFPNRRQSTSPKGCTILLCIKQICPFNVWRWRNAMTPSEAISRVKMKFLSSQMSDRLKGLYCRTGVRRYAEVWCKVVWVCLPISLNLKFVSRRRDTSLPRIWLRYLEVWCLAKGKFRRHSCLTVSYVCCVH
jgi:hypothetical protein